MNMSEFYKALISTLLTLSIITLAFFIIHKFIPALLWASVIVIATYPLYEKWRSFFGNYDNLSAFLFTLIFTSLLILPLTWIIGLLIKELQLFLTYLQHLNHSGGQAPEFLSKLPFIGDELVAYWNTHIGNPGDLRTAITDIQISLTPASYYIRQISMDVAHRGLQLGFTIMCLFFCYRDADLFLRQMYKVGETFLGSRWFRYADKLPSALRATVNGTILVSLGVGVLMGICYALIGFPAPTLMGFVTAIAAMVPFVAPIVFIIIATILFVSGNMISALIVIVWGTLVMFVADHILKPILIGGAIELPFLAVLFSILGGVETLGILGLFLGPIIMVLFMTLWHESQEV